ncbi:MAG: hypothetical protein D8B56_04585 [Alloprevotella sp.]|nr:MAG: hypothetical protein D8B56_04585 [Alloprevotella sp.]
MNAFFGHSTLIAYGARRWQISVKPEKLSPRILGPFSGKKLQNLSHFTFMLLGFYFHTLGVLSPRRGDETPRLGVLSPQGGFFLATDYAVKQRDTGMTLQKGMNFLPP